MIRLTRSRHRPDTDSVANKDAIRFGDLNTHSGQTAQRGFFTSVHSGAPSMAALDGDTFGYVGGCVYRFANPAQCRHPRLATRRGLTATHGARMSNTQTLASSCAALRTHINAPGFAESKFLAQHFAAMSRADQLTILALVHSRALAATKRGTQDAGPAARAIVVRKEAK